MVTWKLSRMKGLLASNCYRQRWGRLTLKLCLLTISSFEFNFHSFKESIVWSTKNAFSNFRINNCFFRLIKDDFTFNKLVSRTRVSLLLSELKNTSRRKPYNKQFNLLTELAWVALGNISPKSWQYGPSAAGSVLPRLRANIPQYGPRAQLVSGYNNL